MCCEETRLSERRVLDGTRLSRRHVEDDAVSKIIVGIQAESVQSNKETGGIVLTSYKPREAEVGGGMFPLRDVQQVGENSCLFQSRRIEENERIYQRKIRKRLSLVVACGGLAFLGSLWGVVALCLGF